ncbi:hypothetical protein LCGC14_2080130 [marine sediment metagenome]|uniref:ERCC4 domain-containing protein n=1 Tax=marine sediment metagenome TaxID=412755 RepID=A0A0F9F378_9ZZZZ
MQQQLKATEKIVKIIVDDREHKLKALLDTKKEVITYSSERLDIADIVISDSVAIERKEGSDFVSSIMDNRLFGQLLSLKETYEAPILILEGLNNKVFKNTGMKISSIYGALAYVSYKLGIHVIPTRNLEDTAIVVQRIAYREQIKDDNPILSRKASRGMTEEERRIFIVEGLIDCGQKKATQLIKAFETPANVSKAIKDTEIMYTKTGNPKGIEGPLSQLEGFGWKFVEKNRAILFGEGE